MCFFYIIDIYNKLENNMSKAIINKHIDNSSELSRPNLFVNDDEKRKGEIIICNDSSNPSIYIMNTKGNITKISGGGGSGGSFDDTELRNLILQNKTSINNIVNDKGETSIKYNITVAGLNGKLGNYENGDVIESGTSIYNILQNILCREAYPTNVKTQEASANSFMNDLTVILKNGDIELENDNIVEYGTYIDLFEAKTNGSYTSKKDSQITNITYGYSTKDNDKVEFEDEQIIKECKVFITNNIYTISGSKEGFIGEYNINSQSSKDNASIVPTNLGYVTEGNNSVTITGTGPEYSYTADTINKIYYCSNLGKTDSDHYNDGIERKSAVINRPTKTTTVNIIGKYKYFLGYTSFNNANQFIGDEQVIRNNSIKDGWIEKDSITTIVGNGDNDVISSDGRSIYIACPEKYKLSSINYSNSAPMIDKFTSQGIVSIQTGGIKSNYNVYMYPITNDTVIDMKNITLALKD